MDAVVSALGPAGDKTLHREVALLLIAAMRTANVRRFIGISGAGIDVPRDRKSPRDRLLSAGIQRIGGEATKDKAFEYEAWCDSALDWTLVRPPRLTDGPAAGEIEHDAHRSAKSTKITRADLAAFIVELVGSGGYIGHAPLVANR